MKSALLAGLLLAGSSVAFSGTSPLHVRCGGSKSADIESKKSQLPKFDAIVKAEEVYSRLGEMGCEWDGAMVVFVNGLHSSHLSSLHSLLPSTSSQEPLLQIPYLKSASLDALLPRIEEWSNACLAKAVEEGREGHVVRFVEVDGMPDLPTHLSTIQSFLHQHPSHLLLLTGSPSTLSKRQLVDPLSTDAEDLIESIMSAPEWSDSQEDEEALVEALMELGKTPSSASSSDDEEEEVVDSYDSYSSEETDDNWDHFYTNHTTVANSTKLLDRVQILSTPVITGLLVTFLVFLPVLGVGISALAGIQVPPHMMSISKGMTTGVSSQKKDQ